MISIQLTCSRRDDRLLRMIHSSDTANHGCRQHRTITTTNEEERNTTEPDWAVLVLEVEENDPNHYGENGYNPQLGVAARLPHDEPGGYRANSNADGRGKHFQSRGSSAITCNLQVEWDV